MEDTPMNWAKWPRDGAVSAVPAEEWAKQASFPATPAPSTELAVRNVASILPSWEDQLPEGIEKTAALRDDDSGDALPPVTFQNIWRHPSAHPLVLDILLLDKYGPEYLQWEPEPLRLTLKRDGTLISNSVWVKIQAIRVLHNSPSPWRRWEVFHWTALGLNGRSPNFAYMELAELGHLAVAADIMKIVDRDRITDEEVDKYVASVATELGELYLPEPLDFAQDELENRQFLCTQCGTVNRDDNDVRCPACGHELLQPVPHEHEGALEEVKALYAARKGMPLSLAVADLPETMVGTMAYRLLVHWDYRNEVRSRLIAQFRMLKT